MTFWAEMQAYFRKSHPEDYPGVGFLGTRVYGPVQHRVWGGTWQAAEREINQ